ncbi:ASCH domain-containing protein [Limosilactobacillus mucosae]|uniref:ASCH domain-containing protein n=1 Tax=Limosilactobacillus mucosae TaxID=97478 RepID=UPI001F5A5C5F|nr:ASCH domain-containing protein [Limosilactobacillus mucosae]UNL61557.1 ASCH domain-containing protein [Limosilactobacillus mucosae]
MRVLLSIKPEYVKRIFNGTKKFEYRKKIFKNKDVNTIVIYATKPVGKVVGEFSIRDIIQDNPNKIWNLTSEYSGISKNSFDEYFHNAQEGFAIEIDSFTKYKEALELNEVSKKVKNAPQSFIYI